MQETQTIPHCNSLQMHNIQGQLESVLYQHFTIIIISGTLIVMVVMAMK